MIIYKALLPIFLFVSSESAEKSYDPCSKFESGYGEIPLVKCPSDKTDYDYLECYDLGYKEELENLDTRTMYWCWSRQDNSDDDLRHLTISSDINDNSEFNDVINEPFTANFYINETHIICLENEEWWSAIDGSADWMITNVYCPTSTGISVAFFYYTMQQQM